jgi:hypothetical protein
MDWKLMRKIARDLFRFERIDYEPHSVLTLAHDNDRSFFIDGKYYSPLVDTLEDRLAALGVECLSVARIISTVKGDIAYGDVRSPEGAFARALLTKRFKGLLQRNGKYPFSRMEEAIWEEILDATGATRVVGIMPSRELCTVARRRGIWVADMQHGVMADSHPWYGRRFRSHEPSEYLPHCFLVWEKGSADVLDWVHAHGSHVKTIGNVWLSRFIAPRPDDQLVHRLLAESRACFERAGKKNVLVSLSSCDVGVPEGEIPPELAAVIKATQGEYNWILRLHPNQIKGFASHESVLFHEYYARELNGYATWDEATRHPLPLVLANVDLHVTWSSSVCIEAAHFGIKSALLNPRMHAGGDLEDYYRYYKQQGAIDTVEHSRAAILAWLEANRHNGRHPEEYAAYNREFDHLIAFLSRASCEPATSLST